MDRYYLEQPTAVTPDEATEEEQLIAQSGEEHERVVLEEFKASGPVWEIPGRDPAQALGQTLAAMAATAPVIYQAALHSGRFSGFADFLLLDAQGRYQIWDTKLARAPKPYYAVQLCCYADMLAEVFNGPLSDRFGVILGSKERVEYRLEDFLHYTRRIRLPRPGLYPGPKPHQRRHLLRAMSGRRRGRSTNRPSNPRLD